MISNIRLSDNYRSLVYMDHKIQFFRIHDRLHLVIGNKDRNPLCHSLSVAELQRKSLKILMLSG